MLVLFLFLYFAALPVLLGNALEPAAQRVPTWKRRLFVAAVLVVGTLMLFLPARITTIPEWWLFRLSLFWLPAVLLLGASRLPFVMKRRGLLSTTAPLFFILSYFFLFKVWYALGFST